MLAFGMGGGALSRLGVVGFGGEFCKYRLSAKSEDVGPWFPRVLARITLPGDVELGGASSSEAPGGDILNLILSWCG